MCGGKPASGLNQEKTWVAQETTWLAEAMEADIKRTWPVVLIAIAKMVSPAETQKAGLSTM